MVYDGQGRSDGWQGDRGLLTKQHRQEALSRAYVLAIAARCGMGFSTPSPDYGADLTLNEIEVRGNWRLESGFKIDIQAKSTTRAQIRRSHVRYDLEVKAYEYLRDLQAACPRILVVLVLPENEAEWSSQTESESVLRRCAYWLSLRGWPRATQRKTVRVTLPRANVFSIDGLQTLVAAFKRGEQP